MTSPAPTFPAGKIEVDRDLLATRSHRQADPDFGDKSSSSDRSGDSGAGKPRFAPNPAHTPGQRGFNPSKTPEPADSAQVFENAIQGKDENWYGRGGNDQIYRLPDNTGASHFSGMTGGEDGIPLDRIPIAVRRAFNMVR